MSVVAPEFVEPELENLELSYEIKLTHHKQKSNWDCGISCVLMILPAEKREYYLNNTNSILKSEGICKSTWSIDLCYLLKRFNVHFIYYTITKGIHPGYKNHNFYDKILQKDEERITERFQECEKRDIKVIQSTLTLTNLIQHIYNHGPVILLTNARYLQCDRCKHKKITSDLMSCLPWGNSYHGHYIVLCGFNKVTRRIYYRDPTYYNRVCTISFTALDKARLCYGTDEDSIMIFYK